MKILTIIGFLLITLSIHAQQEENVNKLEERDGLTYRIGKKEPFTGLAISYFENGNKETSTEFKEGRLEGAIAAWYPNGKLQVQGEVIGDIKVGKWIAWYENGNKLREGTYVNNKEEGEYTWWYENGNKKKWGVYSNGVADGPWKWYYETGKLQQEGILIGELNHGVWKEWYENGQQKMEGELAMGVKEGSWTWWDKEGNITTSKVYKDGILVEGEDDLDSYIAKVEYYTEHRDFKAALKNIELALATFNYQSEDAPFFMPLVAYHAKVYSSFFHLDKAEEVLLRAIGLPEQDISIVVNAVGPKGYDKLREVLVKLENNVDSSSKIGPHVALAFLYNVLGDTVSMYKEQQLMMDLTENKDWVISISMALYKLRADKEELYGNINLLKPKVANGKAKRDDRLYLAVCYLRAGLFDEATKVADDFLSDHPDDPNFLLVKMNVAMGEGDLDKMKALEEQILMVNPDFFKE